MSIENEGTPKSRVADASPLLLVGLFRSAGHTDTPMVRSCRCLPRENLEKDSSGAETNQKAGVVLSLQISGGDQTKAVRYLVG